MKKKGLIISTIVMVVVLIAALTTSTYAWFTTSAVTKIDAFNVSVKTNNAVKIGVKANNTYAASPTEDLFVTGTVTYTDATSGQIGGGSWAGDPGLSANLDHNIAWGEQSKAIGFSATAVEVASGASSLLSSLGASNKGYIYAANGDTSLTNISAAVANTDGAQTPASDYVHLFLGVAPTRGLTTSELIILVKPTGSGVTVGVLAALHVAYRLNSNGNWTDVDVYGNSYHYNSLKSAVTVNLTTEGTVNEAATYQATYGEAAPGAGSGAQAVKITDLATTANQIDQIEILIYIDGSDGDCTQNSINNIAGAISIFFHTTEPAA